MSGGKPGMALAAIVLQVAAAIYFLIDAVAEAGPGALSLLDLLVGAALLAGIAYAARALLRSLAEGRRQAEALAVARGALGGIIEQRFAEWSLSPGEAEVALFALKGFGPAEIAQLRGSATGTVRSQLSSVYAKAGVGGQPTLMALFLDELIDGASD